MAPLGRLERYDPNDLHEFAKRSNWASREPGVIVIFCIVFLVTLGIISLFAYRRWMKHNAEKQNYETA